MALDLGNVTPQPSGSMPGGSGGGYSWQEFNNLRQQIAARNQALNVQGPDYFSGYNGTPNTWRDFMDARNQETGGYTGYQGQDRSPFSLSGGTEGLYNGKYRKANTYDQLAIAAGEAGKWWMNLPGEIAGWAGGEQAKKDWTFDANKFDLGNGLDAEDLTQIRNFAVSIPGMIPGGLFEGVEKGYEAATGAPVQERRKTAGGDWEIADYQLDWNQRAAAGLDAAIDIGGTFIGGSGKAISVGGKAIARGLANRALNKAEKGIASAATEAGKKEAFEKGVDSIARANRLSDRAERFGDLAASSGEGLLAKAGFGKGAQFGWNVAEEAGEEFAQSYLEDFRNKEYDPKGSFDKAVQSAAWGALGGGIMHGLGAAGNAVFHSKYDEQHRNQERDGAVDPTQQVASAFSRSREYERFKDRNTGYSGGYVTSAIESAIDERLKDPARVPASASAFGTQFSNDLNSKQIRISTDVLDGITQMDDDGKSIHGIAQLFGVNDKAILDIKAIGDNIARQDAWVNLFDTAKANGTKMRVLAGRNPDTNKIGVAAFDLVDVTRGGGVQLGSSFVWKMLGGDVDGDRYQTYLSPIQPTRDVGYITRNLWNDSIHRSNLDKDYVTFFKDKKATFAFRRSFNRTIHDLFEDENIFDKKTVEGFVRDFHSKNLNSIDDVTMFLVNLRTQIMSKTDEKLPASERWDIADEAIARIMHDMHLYVTKTARTFDSFVTQLTEEQQREVEEATKSVTEDLTWLRSGDNLGKTHAAEFLGLFGRRIALNTGADLGANSVMRQSAMYKFEAFEEQDVWFDQSLSHSEVQDRFKHLIAYSFSLETIGADVENAIEGVFWTSVIDSTLTRFYANNGRIDVSGNWESFVDILIDEYNSKAKDYNSVISRESTAPGMDVLLGSKKKEDIRTSDMADVAQVFRRTFGDYTIDSIVSVDKNSSLRGVTFNQLLHEYAKCHGFDYGPLSGIPGLGKLFPYLVKDYNSTHRALQNRYESAIEEMGNKLVSYELNNIEDLIDIKRDSDGKIVHIDIIAQDRLSLINAVTAAQYMIGEDECITLGIATVESFLSTKWGEDWMSGDASRMTNVVLAAKVSHLYKDVVNLVVSQPANWENDVELELARLASNGGVLETAIYADWMDHHDLGLLKLLQDLDTSYGEKCQIWEQATRNIVGANPLLAELFATGNESIGTSIYTNKLKHAKRSMVQASKTSNVFNRQILKNIRDDLGNASDAAKAEAIKHFITDAYTTTSVNAVAAFVHSQRDMVKDMVDKGLAPTTTDIVYQMRETVLNGGLFSSLEDIDLAMGSITFNKLSTNRVQILKCLSDPTLEIRAWDESRNDYVWISRDAIFREVLGDSWKAKGDPDTSFEPWDALFEACPALISLVAPTHVGVQTNEGNASANEGTKKTLDKAMIDYINGGKDVKGDYMHAQKRNEVFHIAMGDPNWWAVLVADPRFSKTESLSETRDIVQSAINDNLEWIMTAAAMDPKSVEYYEKTATLGREAVDQMFMPVQRMARDIDINRALAAYTGSVDSEITSRIYHGATETLMSSAIDEMLADAGLKIEHGQLKVGKLSKKKREKRAKKRARKALEAVTGAAESVAEAAEKTADLAFSNLDDNIHLIYALMNMVDPNLFNVPDYLRTQGIRDLEQQLDVFEETNRNDQDAMAAAQEVREAIRQFDDGGIGGFTAFVFDVDVVEQMRQESWDDVITQNQAATMSEKEFTDAVLWICDKYNYSDGTPTHTEKVVKDIHRAFGIENETERVRRLNNIRNYYNQLTVEYILKQSAPSGSVYNLLAPKQTMDAYQTMFAIADKVREKMGGRLEPRGKELPSLNVDFGNPYTSCMSQHMAMNAASGSITTGIGLNGSMLNLIGGLGLIDTMEPIEVNGSDLDESFFGWTATVRAEENGQVTETTQTITYKNIDELRQLDNVLVSKKGFLGDSTETLINYLQEDLNLRLKKSLGAIKAFSDQIETDRSMCSDMSISEVRQAVYPTMQDGDLTARDYIAGALKMRRGKIETKLLNWFNSEEMDGSGLGVKHAKMYANVMCNLIEVRVGKDAVNGVEAGVYHVSSAALASEEEFAKHNYDFGYGVGVLPPADNIRVRPVVMGLQEVSTKIIRNVARNYYAQEDAGSHPSEEEVLKWANDGMMDFDNYNSNPIGISDFLSSIQANPAMVDNPMLGDMNYTARMLWNDERTGSLQAALSPRDAERRAMSDGDWKKVRGFNEYFSGKYVGKGDRGFFDSHQIVKYFNDGEASGLDANARSLPKDVGNEDTRFDEYTQKQYDLIELYDGNSIETAKKLYHGAASRNHPILISRKLLDTMRGTVDGIAMDSFFNESVKLGTEEFVIVDSRGRSYYNKFRKENMRIATTEMDSSEISIAMGTRKKLGLPDAGHLKHPDFNVGKRYTDAVDVTPTRILNQGFGPVQIVTDLREVATIPTDQIDFSYYEHNIKNKDIDTYKNNAVRFIDSMAERIRSGNTVYPKSLSNVNQDGCVGFIKQAHSDGSYTYAPLFYEGSVASVADSVVVRQSRNGYVRISYASSNVDYGGRESTKMDLYGVAYKTVGTTATEQDLRSWAAISAPGYDSITRADIMFDENSVASRLFELGDSILHNNVVYFTRKTGINAFFEKRDGEWTLRQDLHSDMDEATLRSLISGSPKVWELVANEELHVYADEDVNRKFARAVSDIQGVGGFAHLLFNTARVELDANGKPVFRGLERRNFDPHAVFKYWNTDDFLSLWNHLDSRLCPATLTENDADKVFDRYGRMLDMNTTDGVAQRCVTVVGPNFFSGEGTAITDYSRSATFSNQHIVKRMLADGLYRGSIRETVDALSVAVNLPEKALPHRTMDEQIEHWRSNIRTESAHVDASILAKVSEAIKDPLYLSVIDRRKQALNEKAEDMYSQLLIVESVKKQTPASQNKELAKQLDRAVERLNQAIGTSRIDELTMGDVIMLVRNITGITTNANGGIKTITASQFLDAVDQMVANKNEHGVLIVGGRYKTRGDLRASNPLLPRGLNTKLATSKAYMDRYHGDVDAIVEDQYKSLDATVDFVKTIEDPAKRNELMQLIDAMCMVNGKPQKSGHLLQGIYMHDIIDATRKFGMALQDVDPELFAQYDAAVKANDEWANKIAEGQRKYKKSRIDLDTSGNYEVVMHGDDRTIVTYILRQMAAGRRVMGLTYLEMPLSNMLDRQVGQTMQGWAYSLGRLGIGPYRVTQKMNNQVREEAVKSGELKKFWSALREAQLLGVDRELMAHIYSGQSLDDAITATLKDQGAIERFSNKVMNIASGKDFGIEKQMQNFIDRMWQRSQTEAPWWHQKLPGHELTVFEEKLAYDPIGLMVDLFSGKSEGKSADALLTRQCLNQALAGDMAQKNLVSAFVGEVAKRSAASDFVITTAITPYFQYATNRMGKILNTVAPISSLHYLATKFMTEGVGGTMRIAPWSETTFGELGLDEANVKANLRESIWCDMCHMGGTVVAMMLAGLALTASGILEPPEDDDKKGNFEEWTFFGMRINANWWIEDSLGIALPLACFWASAMRGEPRIDLMFNGISHYLSNNPVTKVADAAAVLFDPMAELYREYDQDVEGYAKAMGGPPDVWQILKGKMTSFGLSYAAQFITPGILREFYQATQGNEVAYKRVFETDATGKLTLDAKDNNRTMYTSYEDATIRKFTKDNPVMGFLADILMRPETGYMNHEMPDRIIYDPEQMNSIQAFSMYEDPYTKTIKKSPDEQYATALMLIATLQSNSVEDLVKQGFMIDYDTKNVVGQVIWDMIATENAQWADLEQQGAFSYYNAGYGSYDDNVRVISEMREAHKAYIQNLKDLYHNKLWSDELYSVAMYNQKNTEWAQDVHGDWYATGFAPTVGWPFILADGESPGEWQAVMSRENDWQTESVVTGNPTGQRSLVPVDMGRVDMPDKPKLESYSSDGTTGGHSDLYGQISEGLTSSQPNSTTTNGTKSPNGGGTGYGRRSGGGGGGGGRSGGSGYTPNTSAPSVRAPVTSISLPRTGLSKVNPSRIMGTDRLVEPNEQYLRPDFETKGSREAYKRSDI